MDTTTKISFGETENGSNGWNWHYGMVEQDGKEFPVTILEMKDENSGSSSFELIWCDDTPNNSTKLENEIMRKFK